MSFHIFSFVKSWNTDVYLISLLKMTESATIQTDPRNYKLVRKVPYTLIILNIY